jgi:hypothetical protein
MASNLQLEMLALQAEADLCDVNAEVMIRRAEDVELTPALRSSMDVLLLMMKEVNTLFENRTDQLPHAVSVTIQFIEAKGLEQDEIFGYRASRGRPNGLIAELQQGKPLPEDTDVHVATEILRILYERLPRRPFNFERYEPPHAFNEMKSASERVAFVKDTLRTVDEVERQLVGAFIRLLTKIVAHSETNRMDGEALAALLSPLIVDGRWLNYKQPPVVKLKQAFVL